MASSWKGIFRSRRHSRSPSRGLNQQAGSALVKSDERRVWKIPASPSEGNPIPGQPQLTVDATERPRGHQYHDIALQGNARGHFGDNYISGDVHNHYASQQLEQTDREG